MKRILLFLMIVGAMSLAACGNESETIDAPTPTEAPLEPGDAVRGEKLYKQTIIGTANSAGCAACHSLEPDVTLVGPSHATIGADAASRVPGMSAEDFLRESIIDPNAHISDGFTVGAMYANYGEELSAQEIEDLVAYMLTLQ